MRADVERAVLVIVTCTRAPKALGYRRSGATRDWDLEEMCGSRNDWTIITKLHDKGTIGVHGVFV